MYRWYGVARFLLGYRPDVVRELIGLSTLAEERIMLGDARDLDAEEAEFLDSSRVSWLTLEQVSTDAMP